MSKELTGKRIVIAGSRKTEEMSALIEKQGGVPIVRPLQGTVFKSQEKVVSDLLKLIQEGTDWAIFTTGIGIETLLDIAENLGVKDQLINIFHQAKIASRGYKTLSALKKLGVTTVAVDEDGTTKGLIKTLEAVDFTGKRVIVQLHGEKAPSLIQFLEEKEAAVSMILPYEHIPPQKDTVAILCEELMGNKVDAVCFTTATQVRSLFDFAREKNTLENLLTCFHSSALAVAVGKVTSEALREEGINRVIVPENERMGAMIIELCRYYEKYRQT